MINAEKYVVYARIECSAVVHVQKVKIKVFRNSYYLMLFELELVLIIQG